MPNNSAYYYSRLSAAEKAVYKALRTGIESFSAEIRLPFASQNEISKAFNCVLWDNPLIFYTSSYTMTSDTLKRQCRLYPNYTYAPRKAKGYIDEIMRYLHTLDAIQGRQDIDKELYVHDFCLNHFKYDYAFGKHAHSVLGPVFNKAAVCEGIAKFVKLALDYLDVKSIIVHGEASDPAHGTNSGHTWNIVEISGQTFHLDVTFDLTLKTNHNRYDYFNLSDEDIKKDHSFANDLPKCVIPDKDYYSNRGMVANTPAELKTLLENSLKQGKKIITVKLRNITDPANILDRVIAIAQRQYLNLYKQSVMVEVRYNLRQMVFEIEYKK